jgi:hypothetical protein
VEGSKQPTFIFYLLIALILSVIGWGGLFAVIQFTLPTLGPRWLFFFLCVLALSGITLPVTYFINRRFPSHPPADPGVIVRQAIWVGVYGSTLAWLQLGRMLTLMPAGLLAIGLLLTELLLRMRERARWHPQS